jgi:HSP20 family protein
LSERRSPAPQSAAGPPARRPESASLARATLRGAVDRLFDNFWRGFGTAREPGLARLFEGAFGAAAPALDVVEADDEFGVTAELPGMDAKNVELTLADDMLAIKGEKREEREEREESYHLSERRYGSFQRSLPLPRAVDCATVEARFDKGVLTMLLPKTQEAAEARAKIDIDQGSWGDAATAPRRGLTFTAAGLRAGRHFIGGRDARQAGAVPLCRAREGAARCDPTGRCRARHARPAVEVGADPAQLGRTAGLQRRRHHRQGIRAQGRGGEPRRPHAAPGRRAHR